jgi:hypothetical protein
MTRCKAFAVLSLVLLAALPPALAQADISFAPGTAKVTALNTKGTLATQAGSHPDSFGIEFELNTEPSGHTEGGELRDVIFDLPPGFLGNPETVTPCSRQQFEGNTPRCPGASQVGVARAVVFDLGEVINPIYMIEPQPGFAAQLGFSVFNFAPQQFASVRTDEGYGLRVATPSLPLEISTVQATVWGTPREPSHDPERVCAEGAGAAVQGCSAGPPPYEPFLTMPTGCGPFETTLRIDSKQEPKQNPLEYISETVPLRDAGGNAAPIVGCDAVPFSPKSVSASGAPTGESPSGLAFGLEQPNQGLLELNEPLRETEPVTETEAEKMEVTLPQGLSVNPSAANGQGVCRLAQYRAAACPEDAKLGTLLVHTPLLDEAIEGSIYLAAPHENPFDSLLALYIVGGVPKRGIVVKQAGEAHADPVTGQLTSVFDGLPPVPYSSFEVRLREGPRAPLITPQLCGTYTTQVKLYPFSAPGSPLVRTVPFKVTSGAGGGGCAPNEAQLPNTPILEAGVTAPLAAAYSPFVFKLSRPDGSQRFAGLQATLPKGLTARLAGVPYCSEPQIAAATARNREGEGALELTSPSCPTASQIGIVNVAAGAGPSPYYVQGKAYLAGPYKGAPLSVAIVTPAIAGPFDLGAVVVRTALYVDETTAEVRAVSDPLPTILAGIPLDVRSVSLQMNRSSFTLNPTNCEPLAVTGTLTTTTGATALLKNRFQVGGCKGLPFKPKLSIRFKGKSNRRSHPKVIATLSAKRGEANTSFAQVKLPKAAFLDNAHIKTICTRVQFAAEACPPASIYGRAEATTPLLDYPLSGNVYLRSSSHTLPDLVIAFKGPPFQPIKVVLSGRTDAVKGALRNTFETAPDVPVSKFRLELFGGKRGLVVLSGGLCRHRAATVLLRAHSGKEYETRPKVKASCGKGTKQGKRRR